jgi:hypothetical protein
MFERLTRGLALAARSGATPLLIGARVAGWRRIAIGHGIPAPGRGLSTTSKMALDELFLATELAAAPIVRVGERARIGRELDRALSLFDRSGWIDTPERYHQTPPPLEISEIRESRRLGISLREVRYESGYTPHRGEPGARRWRSYQANRTAHARLYVHPGESRPWLVCIPGYRMGHPAVDFAGFRVRWLHRELGLNIAIPVMPLHGPRRQGRRGGDGFFSGDVLDTIHAQAQAVWDVRRLVRWLRLNGAPAIGVHGVSLGGYTAALTASLEDDLACAITGIPATSFVRLLESHLPDVALRALDRGGFGLARLERLLRVVSPLHVAPRVPRQRRYVYAGVADRLATPEHARDLWEHWERPRAVWYDGSHVSFLWEPEVRAIIEEALLESGLHAHAT